MAESVTDIKAPTEKQLLILQRIEDFFALNGFRPALYEVATDRGNLELLRARGWITWERDLSGRTLRLTEAGKALLAKHTEVKP
jgi:hypothetical protein